MKVYPPFGWKKRDTEDEQLQTERNCSIGVNYMELGDYSRKLYTNREINRLTRNMGYRASNHIAHSSAVVSFINNMYDSSKIDSCMWNVQLRETNKHGCCVVVRFVERRMIEHEQIVQMLENRLAKKQNTQKMNKTIEWTLIPLHGLMNIYRLRLDSITNRLTSKISHSKWNARWITLRFKLIRSRFSDAKQLPGIYMQIGGLLISHSSERACLAILVVESTIDDVRRE